jgi:hypothetical protein
VPQRVNVVVAREDGKPARVAIDPTWGGQPWGPAPPAMVAALGASRIEPIVPWRDDAYPTGDVATDVIAPEVTVVSKHGNRVELRIRTVRDAPMLYVIAAGLVHVDVAGAIGTATFFRRFIAPTLRGIRIDGANEVTVTLTFVGSPGDVFVADGTYGAPSAASVIAARPADAVATQDGDVTIAYRRVSP